MSGDFSTHTYIIALISKVIKHYRISLLKTSWSHDKKHNTPAHKNWWRSRERFDCSG